MKKTRSVWEFDYNGIILKMADRPLYVCLELVKGGSGWLPKLPRYLFGQKLENVAPLKIRNLKIEPEQKLVYHADCQLVGDKVCLLVKVDGWQPRLFHLYDRQQKTFILNWLWVAKQLGLDQSTGYCVLDHALTRS